ncbi:Dissimilatory sulfite reductase [Desulfosporosinus sp. I2]|uniref:4Fe-4S binding protein n=1 Tax=Desulfosporosinus sp. I2 TaxID=1617025 RepID=UPI0005EEB621|nr:4Fe-4S binding protein [Desulfosporosinus sp. I2]KJR47308.1 Dissimilatory sulfite reductase [Desulfosporosinus sp. I2]
MAKVYNKSIKPMGFMRQVQKDCFSMRLRVAGGQIRAEQLKKVYEIAQIYGKGYIHLTSRQGIEIPFIRFEDIDTVKRELVKAGLEPGSSGPRVRAVTACQGNAICPSGLIDTTALADELDKRYFAKELKHKFKIGVTGCRNNCLKAEENDLGIKGGIQPTWEKTTCNFCGLCEAVCPGEAIKVDKGDRNLVFEQEKCLNCGKCVKSCPLGAWHGKSGFLIYLGGTLGNQIANGKQFLPLIFEETELFRLIDATLEFFAKYGKPRERFRQTIERIGWEFLEEELLNTTMITRDEFVNITDIVAR